MAMHKTLKNQEEIKHYTHKLSSFYQQFGIYVISNIFFIFLWLISGESYFWPIWVIIGWGIPLFFMALDLEILPSPVQKIMSSLRDVLPLPFLKAKWQAQQVERIVKEKTAHSSFENAKEASSKKEPKVSRASKASKPVAKKSVSKAPAKVKTAAKKPAAKGAKK